jgi:macrolide transport system ATP-binding/permease protein
MAALIELKDVWRDYGAGSQVVSALRGLSLQIEPGEYVAIVGASGSGKSTLMNILGCLDRPTRGDYRIAGHHTAQLDPDELAALRREHFGFIFQRYHLMGELDAVGNVEIPAIYAGRDRTDRRERARSLLGQLGLSDRLDHHPAELSGGQQQRVSIARALMNGGEVILADEPTGALDSRSGAEMLRILDQLNAQGHTIILVTHDMDVAGHARRIVELKDGEIIADRRTSEDGAPKDAKNTFALKQARVSWRAFADRFGEAARMAVTSITSHRLRSFLTMLGIIIGIASVVSIVALGQGSRERVMKNISALGSNTIAIYPGTSAGDVRSAAVQTLTDRDADALRGQSFVDSVTPSANTSAMVRYGDIQSNGTVNGVGDQYFRVQGVNIAQGVAFDAQAVQERAQEAVIDDNTRAKLFPHGENPLGQVIILGAVPVRIVGVAEKRDNGFFADQNLNVFVPYTTVMGRMTGQSYLRSITIRVPDNITSDAAQAAIEHFMEVRHGRKDFFLQSSDSVRKTIDTTLATLTLLITAVAAISLLVGGIGVMNIMLVSVRERTREIGVRCAVGARRSDILSQFLIEAVLICLLGGGLGVSLALGLGALLAQAPNAPVQMIFSPMSMVVAFGVSTLIGLSFGFFPARSAARLDPVEALARE